MRKSVSPRLHARVHFLCLCTVHGFVQVSLEVRVFQSAQEFARVSLQLFVHGFVLACVHLCVRSSRESVCESGPFGVFLSARDVGSEPSVRCAISRMQSTRCRRA